jgi:hypothetical protein
MQSIEPSRPDHACNSSIPQVSMRRICSFYGRSLCDEGLGNHLAHILVLEFQAAAFALA